jgi:hypothetical protein
MGLLLNVQKRNLHRWKATTILFQWVKIACAKFKGLEFYGALSMDTPSKKPTEIDFAIDFAAQP